MADRPAISRPTDGRQRQSRGGEDRWLAAGARRPADGRNAALPPLSVLVVLPLIAVIGGLVFYSTAAASDEPTTAYGGAQKVLITPGHSEDRQGVVKGRPACQPSECCSRLIRCRWRAVDQTKSEAEKAKTTYDT